MPLPQPAVIPTFNDVPTGYWAYSFIQTLADNGITAGCGNGNYCPFKAVTRAEMAVFLLRSRHGGDYVPPAASGEVFVDVPSSYWGAPWIEQLAAEGITGGCGSTNYCPFRNVTRAEMAVFLLRAVHGSDYMPPAASGAVFLDVPAGFWGASWIEQLKAEEITSGCGNGNYCAFREVTRAEMAVFLVRTFGLQSAEQCAAAENFDYASVLNGANSTLTASVQNLPGTSDVTVNGADTATPIGPFTFDWGDGTETTGWFPQDHSYADTSQNYVVTVTAHYADQTTNKVLSLARFQPPVIARVINNPALAVTLPDENITLGTRLYNPPVLSHFDDSFFNEISREVVDYVLTVAANLQYEYMNQDLFLIDGGFNQVVLLDPGLAGGMYSLWYTNPVAFGAGPTAFSGLLPYSSFFHEMGHNVTLNTPAIFYYGGKIDGPANAIYSETMAQIVAHVTAYGIVNQGTMLGLSCDLVFDIRQDALQTASFIRQQFDTYVNTSMPFASWNVPATPTDETFGTFMTLAYIFLNHAQARGAGFSVPLRRMMALLQNTANVSLILSVRTTNSPAADSIRATLMVAAISYAFEEDLSSEFQALNFPVDNVLHDQLYDAAP